MSYTTTCTLKEEEDEFIARSSIYGKSYLYGRFGTNTGQLVSIKFVIKMYNTTGLSFIPQTIPVFLQFIVKIGKKLFKRNIF